MSLKDPLTGADVGIDFEHYLSHTGKIFIASYKSPDASPIADNSQIDFLIKCNAKPAHLSFFIGGNGDIEPAFYENVVTSNDGTQLAVVALNRNRSFSPTTEVWRDPTITTIGDNLLNTFESWSTSHSYPLPGLVFSLKPNTNYLVRAINRNGGNQPMSILVVFHELFEV